LKTVAIVARQFPMLINHPNSSARWLLIRTQAIGDAGETSTPLKVELQRLKMHMKEIYHRKFHWNQTQLNIDGAKHDEQLTTVVISLLSRSSRRSQ
jgi:hypothetical protein